jgi:hypothetical protein
MPFPRAACVSLLLLFASPAHANDGFGGISATGLTFTQTDAVAMEQEDLFIGIDRIAVDYVFRNITDQDVTGEVIFPLPPISLSAMMNSDWNLPDDRGRENLVNFAVEVDGVKIGFKTDRIAVIEPAWVENRTLSQQYDTPGRDVTADLARFGIPLTLDTDALMARLLALDADTRAQMQAAGLADFFSAEGASAPPTEVYPAWSVVLRYHWTQTFPAGKRVAISHAYENRPGGGLFQWQHPPVEDYQADDTARYCIDNGTSKAIAKALHVAGQEVNLGMDYRIAYVLRTANSWAGPIGKFRLTLDKGSPRNVISLCANGIEKTSPTTFVMEKTNFTPTRDLEILVVQATGN